MDQHSNEKDFNNQMKTNVLFLITSLAMGGAEKQVLYLAKELKKTSEFNPIIACFDLNGPFVDEARNFDIPFYSLKRRHKYDILLVFKLLPILKKENIHILHSHMFYSNIIARFAGFFARTPVILNTEHGQSVWKTKPLLLMDCITQALVDKIITVSDFSRTLRNKREKISKSRLQIINNFVNTNEIKPTQNKNISILREFELENSTVLGMLTRLNENKRVKDAILALYKIKDRFPSVKLVILGDGPLREELEAITTSLALSERVTFAGFQNNIQDWLSVIDIFLLLSVREDFPVSILEAMAAGKPVLATDVGGIPEIIDDSVGRLIPPEQPNVLADELSNLLQDTGLMKQMGNMARKKIENMFSEKIIVAQIIELYNSCLKATRNA